MHLFHKNKFTSGEKENDNVKKVDGLWREVHLGTNPGSGNIQLWAHYLTSLPTFSHLSRGLVNSCCIIS